MPSSLKMRRGRPSYAEMRADLDAMRKPTARRVEAIFQKYHKLCLEYDPPLREVEVREPGVNWKDLILSMREPRSSEILGCGIRKVLLAEAECVYDGVYRLHVQRLDGSRVSFEWQHAYDDPYHHFKDRSCKHDVETAMRAAVLPQLVGYKEMLARDSELELVSHISGIALPWERAAVQHFPITLHQLVDAFLNEQQLKIEQIKLAYDEDHAFVMTEPQLRDAWRAFHRSHASYRIISTDEAMDQDHL